MKLTSSNSVSLFVPLPSPSDPYYRIAEWIILFFYGVEGNRLLSVEGIAYISVYSGTKVRASTYKYLTFWGVLLNNVFFKHRLSLLSIWFSLVLFLRFIYLKVSHLLVHTTTARVRPSQNQEQLVSCMGGRNTGIEPSSTPAQVH